MDSTAPADVRRIRWSATAGTIAPIWFWVTLTTLALLHGTIDVSGHQLLRYGFLMYVGFFVYGFLTLAFVWGLRRRLPFRRRSGAAVVALILFGCGPLLGTFTEGVEQGPPQSWHGWLHFIGFLLVSLIPIVALPLFGCAVWNEARWRPLGQVSVAWGVVVAVVVFLPSSPAEGYALWSGPGSMADITLIGIWQIVVSRRLARLARKPATAEQTADARAAENASR
jgi:hypothetical protein